MTILSAAAAFAVLMIVFSTAITGLTEGYLRITSARSKFLASSVLRFLKEDPTVLRFARQSAEHGAPTWFESVVNRVNAGKLLTGVDQTAIRALAALRHSDLETQARDAENAAISARELADKAAGNGDDAQLQQAAANAEKAAENARLAERQARNLARKATSQPSDIAPTTESVLVEGAYDAQVLEAFDTLTLNQTLGKPISWFHWLARLLRALIPGAKEATRVERLSTYSFIQRLAKTDVGLEIARSGEELALRTLTMSFERYVAASNEVFRKHAQATTMVLSIAFAFAFNIDAIRLFQHLQQNPQFSAALIERGENAEARFTAANDRLVAVLEALPAPGPDTAPDDDSNQADVTQSISDLRTDLETVAADIDGLAVDLDLPIGWQLYPFSPRSCLLDLVRQNCPGGGAERAAFVPWLLGTLLGGVLIGLGGPFWYRVFASLSHLVQVLRSIRGEPRQEGIEKDNTTEQPASQEMVRTVLGGEDIEDGALMAMFQASTGRSPGEFP